MRGGEERGVGGGEEGERRRGEGAQRRRGGDVLGVSPAPRLGGEGVGTARGTPTLLLPPLFSLPPLPPLLPLERGGNT